MAQNPAAIDAVVVSADVFDFEFACSNDLCASSAVMGILTKVDLRAAIRQRCCASLKKYGSERIQGTAVSTRRRIRHQSRRDVRFF